MTPTHVEVNRCAGSCHNFKQSCVSTKSKMKVVRVLLAKCGINVGRCDKECVSVEVEEDVECGCQCGLTSQDCSPDQEFMKDKCVCECKDRESERNCQDSGRVWDRLTCSCQCPVTSVRQCSAGLIFDNGTCSCVPHFGDNQVKEPLIEIDIEDNLLLSLIHI